MKFIRWLGKNIGSFLLAFLLALLVWVSAVTSSDPNQEEVITIPLEVFGQAEDMVILEDIPRNVDITVYAPQSKIEQLKSENIRAWITVEDLQPGTYRIPVQVDIPSTISPVRHISTIPNHLELSLDSLVEKTIPITKHVEGEPSIGYEAGEILWDAQSVTVAGRISQVEKVESVEVTLDISGAVETIETRLELLPLNSMGEIVPDVSLNPKTVQVTQKVELLGGYRNVAVKVVTQGQVASGYRTASITPAPPTVMIFSEDPKLVDQLPGYVETESLDLTGVDAYVETILELNLPEGVTVVGDPNVLVQVSVVAFNDSLSLSREVEVIGILPSLEAIVAPPQMEVVIYGPIPVLDELTLRDVRVIVDLTNLEEGVHSLTPTVEVLPEDLSVESLVPSTVEVTIVKASTPTITPEATQAP
ncbi:MAG: CdaA regulatory protein CdaR [Chloroflexi bacterium]|nr:CdaA regulatory protein CdaR [Chloroflexota bacterium]